MKLNDNITFQLWWRHKIPASGQQNTRQSCDQIYDIKTRHHL